MWQGIKLLLKDENSAIVCLLSGCWPVWMYFFCWIQDIFKDLLLTKYLIDIDLHNMKKYKYYGSQGGPDTV